ncbi:MAG: TolC family protein [Armatimonadota bacterium]
MKQHRLTHIVIITICGLGMLPGLAQQTPPIMPNIQETPLPPAVELPAPATLPADVPNTPLTAEEAARIALHHQPSITVATAGLAAAQARQQQAHAGLKPNLVVGAGYSNITTTSDIAGGSPGGGATGFQTSANIRQLLYDFNHTRTLVQQSKALESAAGANLTRVRSDLVLQVKQAFYLYAQNTRFVDVNAANLKNRQNHLALAQARLKAGVGLPVDVVRAETAVADAVLALNLARTSASVAKVVLAQLMGVDPRTPIVAAESHEPVVAADNLEALTVTALQRRADITQAQAGIQAANYGITAAKTSNSPVLVGTIGFSQRGADFPPSSNSLAFGVAVQWNLFDSGLADGRVKEAQANLVAAQAALDATQLNILSGVSQAYLNVKTAEQRVITADAGVANAQEGLRLAQGRYQAGLGVFLDVLDAQTALLTAQTNRVNAQSAVDQSRAALLYATNSDPIFAR